MPVFYGAVDLSQNELRNARVQNLGAAPSTPVTGQLWYDSTNQILKWWNGSTWIPAMSGGSLSPATTVTTQAVGDAAVVGTSANYAREDHKHGREAFGATVVAETSFGQASAVGSATTLARSDHTHGTPAAPASATPATSVTNETVGTAAVVGTSTNYARQDHAHGWVAALANLDMGNFNIVNLLAPVNGTDAVNKTYVDNAIAGLTWKQPVRAIAVANWPSASGLGTIDGVALADGDRVLLTAQTSSAANGIWVAHVGTWTRATDADSSAELVNAACYVSEGTTYADTAWVQTTNAPITVGTTGLTWVQFAGGGAVVAGAGMTQAGNTLNVIAGDTSLVVNADELHVNTGVIATVASLAGYAPTTRTISTVAPLAGGGDLSANRTLTISNFTNSTTGVVPASGGGTTNFLRADGSWSPIIAAPATVAGKFAGALNGTSSPEVITHNLNTRDIQLTVLNGSSPYTAVEVDWDATTVNTATIRYNPNLGAGYRVVIVG